MNYSRETLQALADADAARKAESWSRYHTANVKRVVSEHAPSFGRDPNVIVQRARSGLSNPFDKAAPNLTEQMILTKHAPELVARLKALAEVR